MPALRQPDALKRRLKKEADCESSASELTVDAARARHLILVNRSGHAQAPEVQVDVAGLRHELARAEAELAQMRSAMAYLYERVSRLEAPAPSYSLLPHLKSIHEMERLPEAKFTASMIEDILSD